jgi:hypothetical protein
MATNETIRKARYRVKNSSGQYEVVYLETSADQVETDKDRQFVSEAEKQQFLDNTVFTTDMKTVSALGGISANTDLNGMSVQDLLTKLLFPYVKPTISLSSTPVNGGTYEYGNTQTITKLTANITKKSEKISKVEILDGSTVLHSVADDSIANGGTVAVDTNIAVKTTGKYFTVKVLDASGTSNSANSGTFTFVYPYYMGVVGADTAITADVVKGLTKKVESKGTKSHSYDCANQKMVIAYPKAHGVLKTILDPNNFNMTDAFNCELISIVGLDGTAQDYYVYSSGASTVSGFKMTFSY